MQMSQCVQERLGMGKLASALQSDYPLEFLWAGDPKAQGCFAAWRA